MPFNKQNTLREASYGQVSEGFAQERCRCQRYLHDSDHINCCRYHSRNWYRAHEHVLRATMGVFQAAGYSKQYQVCAYQ